MRTSAFLMLSGATLACSSNTASTASAPRVEWSVDAPPTTADLNGVTWANGMFLVVGRYPTAVDKTVALTSVDGTTWQAETAPPGSWALGKPLWDGTRFIVNAVPDGKSKSPSQTLYTAEAKRPLAWKAVDPDPRVAVAFVKDGEYFGFDDSHAVVASRDLVTWRSVGMAPTTIASFTPGADVYVAAWTTGSPHGESIGVMTSHDLTTWTPVTGAPFDDHGGLTPNIGNVLFAGGTFVIPVWSGGTPAAWIALSSDGDHWTRVETPSGTPSLTTVRSAGGRFFAVGQNGAVLTAVDPNTWTSEASGTTQILADVDVGNGVAVAVGSGGALVHRRL